MPPVGANAEIRNGGESPPTMGESSDILDLRLSAAGLGAAAQDPQGSH